MFYTRSVYKKIKKSLKKQFSNHFEKIEREIKGYLQNELPVVQEFDDFSAQIAKFSFDFDREKKLVGLGSNESSDCYLKLKSLEKVLSTLQPSLSSLETVFKTLPRIKVPIKFDVSTKSLNIQLLEMSFLPVFKETLSQVLFPTQVSPVLLKVSTSSFQPIHQKISERHSVNNSEISRNFLSERFHTQHSSRSRKQFPSNTNLDEVSASSVRTKLLNLSVLSSLNIDPLRTTTDEKSSNQNQDTDVNLKDFKNIYETKNKPINFVFQRFSNMAKPPLRESVNVRFNNSPSRKTHTSSLQIKDQAIGPGSFNTSRRVFRDKELSGKTSFNDLKFRSRYQKNVICIEDELGTISNQFVDEPKLRNMILSLKSISKNVKTVILVQNTFVCNPVLILKQVVLERSYCAIILDLRTNKILCSMSHTKRDIDLLRNFNVEVLC